MDHGIGRILHQLEADGIADDTLVLFLSDNGGCAEFLNENGDGRTWPSMYRHTAPPGSTCTVGNIEGLQPGSATTFMSYDLPWANASNTPFRLYKHWVHEGGISTPCVCRWPAQITPGRLVHQPCHIVDFMATFLELAQTDYPEEYNGNAIQPLAGESFAPLLRGDDGWQRERPIFWEHEGNCAMRDGQWKLVSRTTAEGKNGPWELYDMQADRTELNDLAAGERGRVKQMAAAYDRWAAQTGVLPWDHGPRR